MAKHFYKKKKKSMETRDELSIILYLQSEINFCSVRIVFPEDCILAQVCGVND